MLIAPDFVLVHIPKTGGTFLKTLCREHLDVWEPEAFHLAYSDLSDEAKQLPAICFVRNPWDWYVSWFCDRHEAGLNDSFAELLRLTHRGRPDVYSRQFARIAAVEGVRAGRVEVGRFENLRGDFVAFLDRHSIQADGLREAILNAAPVRVNKRTHYRDYYDDELREIVRQGKMVRRFGYEF